MAITTASGTPGTSAKDAKQGRPCTVSYRGLTAHTSPGKPIAARLRMVSAP
jgi:hypothetical protein